MVLNITIVGEKKRKQCKHQTLNRFSTNQREETPFQLMIENKSGNTGNSVSECPVTYSMFPVGLVLVI